MHELGLAEGVLAVALEAAGGAPIAAIEVRIGERHAVLPDSFEFAFRLAAEETSAADARIEIQSVPARLACAACGTARPRASTEACVACGDDRVEAVGGEELTVAGVQLADGTWLRAPAPEPAAVGGSH